ncbi:hypothetical protein [uncultured Hoeflea sp.]|uniref:hypothetical protein n=1 Tax=uncultured Hoeflea sp. TaxID=538666 RepID=UPI00262D3A60|nr:hypothetical protein [uncultured Hoeflea sp.]
MPVIEPKQHIAAREIGPLVNGGVKLHNSSTGLSGDIQGLGGLNKSIGLDRYPAFQDLHLGDLNDGNSRGNRVRFHRLTVAAQDLKTEPAAGSDGHSHNEPKRFSQNPFD